MPRRTALIIPVPEAEPAVGALRAGHDSSAALGVPAHVTILFPFLPPDKVDEDALRDLFARFAAFDFALDRVERFDDGRVWLHPDPIGALRRPDGGGLAALARVPALRGRRSTR